MNQIDFIVAMAILQGRVGRDVTPKQMMEAYGMAKNTLYRYLNKGIDVGYIAKNGRGKYSIARSENMIALGMCLVTPLEMYLELNNE